MLRKVTVRENERAFLIRNGRYVRALTPGSHKILDWSGRTAVEKHNVVNSEVSPETAVILAKRKPRMAAQFFETVQTGEGEIAIISFDGVPTHIQGPWTKRSYWKVLSKVEATRVKTARALRIPKKQLELVTAIPSNFVETALIGEHQAGVLFVDGEFKEKLKPGRHAFWSVGKSVAIRILDLRPIPYEITGEEILTKDRVSLRISLSARTTVKDAKKALGTVPDYFAHLHNLLLLGMRDAFSSRTLDEILEQRAMIDGEIAAYVDEQLGDIGVEVSRIGLTQILLPNDMRDLLNKVVEAEKDAEANSIRRRDAQAATQALLDNARLMDDNPFLLRLKQIDVLEKLADKASAADQEGRENVGVARVLDALLQFEDWHTRNGSDAPANNKVKRLKRAN